MKSGALPLFAGYAAQAGALDVSWVAASVFAGGYLGDEARFFAIRHYGAAAIESRPRFSNAFKKAKKLFDRYGVAYIFLYRYPKGLRTVGALPIGLTNISWCRFTALNAASAALWTSILVGSGYLFGESIRYVVNDNWGVFSVALLGTFLLLSFIAWRHLVKTE